MTINAYLQRLHLLSPQPAAMADFYSTTYGLETNQDDSFLCKAPGREVAISTGQINQIRYALFTLDSLASWQQFLERTHHLTKIDTSAMTDLPEDSVGFRDPDGHLMVFAFVQLKISAVIEKTTPSATLQHFALRTKNVTEMLRFYSQNLGFVVSDRVQDQEGRLKACFLRTDNLHHSLALFDAPVNCFDHQSFESPDWGTLKSWADHMGALRTEIVWGVGRHGPGNDVFFMVRDPDGNLAEISSEIEKCDDDRPAGIWPHEEHTLNLWGKAIMRS